MRQRSNLIILFGIAFFLIGGAIVFLVLNDEDDGDGGSSTTPRQAEVTVFVAAADIAPNTLGEDAKEQGLLATETVPGGSQPVGSITSAAALDNKIFAAGVSEGDVITETQLQVRSLSNVQIPEGFDGVAITVPYTNGGAGYVAPGDRVNIYGLFGESDAAAGLATPPPGDGSQLLPRTELALTNVLVLDVSAQQGTSIDSADGDSEATVGRQPLNTPLTYLFAMRPADVERIVQLSEFADLYVSLTADDAPPAGDTPGADRDSVNGPVSSSSAAPQG